MSATLVMDAWPNGEALRLHRSFKKVRFLSHLLDAPVLILLRKRKHCVLWKIGRVWLNAVALKATVAMRPPWVQILHLPRSDNNEPVRGLKMSFLDGLPQNVKDLIEAANIEAATKAQEISDIARAKNYQLGVRDGDEYFVNARLIETLVTNMVPTIASGQATLQDFKGFLTSALDAAQAARVYADGS